MLNEFGWAGTGLIVKKEQKIDVNMPRFLHFVRCFLVVIACLQNYGKVGPPEKLL